MQDFETAIIHIERLRALGAAIALDDFGTGFSSLSYLRDLPVDVLKIDRSFLSALSEADANMTILEGIIGLARGLGVEMVAEGVETPAQFEWLRAKGCRTFQGYLFGRPVPASDCLRLLRAGRIEPATALTA